MRAYPFGVWVGLWDWVLERLDCEDAAGGSTDQRVGRHVERRQRQAW